MKQLEEEELKLKLQADTEFKISVPSLKFNCTINQLEPNFVASPDYVSEVTAEGFPAHENDTPIILLKEKNFSSDFYSSDGKRRERLRSEDNSPTIMYI